MKAIIFDMYGVILKDPEGSLMPFVQRHFPGMETDDVYRHWRKANVGELSSRDFFTNVGFRGDLHRIEREYLDTVEINSSFYRAAETLGRHYRLALLSNDISEWSNYLREKFDLNKYFDQVVISGDVKLKKPDLPIFSLMLEKLALPASECIYIDDRENNLAAAQFLGMRALLFNNWNVEYSGSTISDFAELVDLLEGNGSA